MRSSNSIIPALIGGLAGAVVVNILNEGLRQVDPGAPRLEKLGMDAANKGFDKFNATPPTGKKLYWGAMAGDILANTLYYAVAASRKSKATMTTGMGLAAGIGGWLLPKPLGLVSAPSGSTPRRKIMTTAYYLLGAWVAGAVAKTIAKS